MMSDIIDCIVFGLCRFLPGSCRFKKRGKNETPLGVSFLPRFLNTLMFKLSRLACGSYFHESYFLVVTIGLAAGPSKAVR